MGLLVDDRHSGEVEGVAGVLLKGADAALTEDDLLVAAGHDVLGAHDPLFDGIAEAALEQNGLVHLAHSLEQLEVLHIAGADLHHVHIFLELGDALLAHQLGDDGHTGGLPGLHHVKDALSLEALEGVGRGAGLVSAAAEEGRAAGLDALCDAEGLLFALDAAGAGHDSDLLLAADLDAAAVDDGICRVEQAVGTLIGGGNTGHVVDPGVGEDVALVDLGGIAHEAKDIVVLAGDEGDVEALLFEAVNDFLEFFLRGPLFGGDDHKIFPFYPSFPRPLCSAFPRKRVDFLHH